MPEKLYLYSFSLPSESAEQASIASERRTCFDSYYPMHIFPQKELREIEFAPITIFCGGNGSGKTTLLNIITEALEIRRNTAFASGGFFERYIQLCEIEGTRIPMESRLLTSDDVFEYLLNARGINAGIDERRSALFEDYVTKCSEDNHLRGMADYDRFKETLDAKRKSMSRYVRERIGRSIQMQSNGESALQFFAQQITQDALFLLDEPENSLSVENQEKLAQFLTDSVRFYGCQFILSTHSPILLSVQGARIYDLDSVPVQVRRWTELENVRRYYEFFQTHKAEFT